MNINPELLSKTPTHLFNGESVKIFTDTINHEARTVSGEILTGPSRGKWTTVYLDQAEEI